MNQALVRDVVAEVMRRLGGTGGRRSWGGVRAGEDAPANEGLRREAELHPHRIDAPVGQYGVFNNVDKAVVAATDAQQKLMKLSLDERDGIVKLVKRMAKENAVPWGKMELEETKIGRLDHKIEKLQILELVPGVEFLKTNADSGSNGMCLEEFAPYGVIAIITPL